MTDGTMFASDIGMNNVEEINIVDNGGNYGWMRREGYWDNGRPRGGELNQLYPLPADILNGTKKDGYIYPVAMYDHDEGSAVTDGFTYHGKIAALRGKFIFGDIQRGRLFASDVAALKKANDGIPQTVASIEEIQLYVRDAAGKRVNVTLQELVNKTLGAPIARADLHIGRSRDGELFITSRQDGWIRMLVPERPSRPSADCIPRRAPCSPRSWASQAVRGVTPPLAGVAPRATRPGAGRAGRASCPSRLCCLSVVLLGKMVGATGIEPVTPTMSR